MVGRALKLASMGGGALIISVFLGFLGATLVGGDDTSSPPERAEKRAGGEPTEEREGPTVTLKRVVDGDTIEVSPAVDGKDTVRLIGIDAPEEKTAGCEAQPLAKEAADHLSNWEGSKVKLEFDEERTDRDGQLLAYVHTPYGVMLNEDLVLGGFVQMHIVPPNTKYADMLREAQREAKEEPFFGRSVWTLSPGEQDRLADHGNGIGQGDGACPPEPQLASQPQAQPEPELQPQPTASSTAAPNPTPNPEPELQPQLTAAPSIAPTAAPDPNYGAPNPTPNPNTPGTAPSSVAPPAGGAPVPERNARNAQPQRVTDAVPSRVMGE